MRTGDIPLHLHFMVADHFEPFCGGADASLARNRVAHWRSRFPRLLSSIRDSVGRNPIHTFFYPEEEYDPFILDRLASFCREGWGDVEIHLHHDGDTSSALREKLTWFKRTLHEKHGLLRTSANTDEIVYGFVHGNWALDNSRRDGRWCGVNDELIVLKETGCYADFTLPSAPSDTQTRKINSLYYAADDASRPKSHDHGVDVEKGSPPSGDLMIVQGPLAFNWRNRKWGFVPRIENGEISQDSPPRPDRVPIWIRYAPFVKGEPRHLFLKLHMHGCNDRNLAYLLDRGGLEDLYRVLLRHCREENIKIHFSTAHEMYQKIKALEGGVTPSE